MSAPGLRPDPRYVEAARLLVVDDDPILCEMAAAHLASPAVTVEVAADGRAGFARLKAGGIDIALVDLEMPVMDGFQLIAAVRRDEDLCDLPIVVATSRSDIAAIDRAYGAGATAFVLKPLNWRVLAYQLAYVLRGSREEDRIRAKAKALRQLVRAQDAVLTECHDSVDRLLRILLEQTTSLAVAGGRAAPMASVQLIGQMWTELEALSQTLRGTSHTGS